ncbi:MAG: AI-2E family transporter [Candidatus Nanopelagicales bacterium]
MTDSSEATVEAVAPEAPSSAARGRTILMDPGNIWRISLVLIAAFALARFLWFILDDGGSVIFTVLMSWFASIAMAPAVDRLARFMPRGLATLSVMVAFIVFAVLFLMAFGALFVEQLTAIVTALPNAIDAIITWANSTFDLSLSVDSIKSSIGFDAAKAQQLATQIAGQALTILGSVASGFFSVFTFGLITFYLSADGPRLRRWFASLFPARIQGVVLNVWDITATKTGGYVGARVVLAAINSATTAVVFLLIGMPYWLPLALWTGIVAQFVPTIGTYISIVLPVVVGLTSGRPIVGILALAWALLYQQVENLTIEPKISARAVDVHPAVAFASVMLGAALFGVAGAFLAVPVMAMLLALLGIYVKRHDVADDESADSDDADHPETPAKAEVPAGG